MTKLIIASVVVGAMGAGTQYTMQQPVEANQCSQIKGSGEYYMVMAVGKNFASIVNMNGTPNMTTAWIDDLVRVNGKNCFGTAWEE